MALRSARAASRSSITSAKSWETVGSGGGGKSLAILKKKGYKTRADKGGFANQESNRLIRKMKTAGIAT